MRGNHFQKRIFSVLAVSLFLLCGTMRAQETAPKIPEASSSDNFLCTGVGEDVMKKCRDIMTKDPKCCAASDTLQKLTDEEKMVTMPMNH